jgi:Coenzyme PQQ synthesis protein D (PqqD)
MATELSVKSRVRISDDVLFQELQEEAVLLNLKTGVYFGLDKVGSRIWQHLKEQEMLSKVVEAMLLEYDVTEERCRQDLLNLIEKMEAQGLVSVSSG